MSDIKGRVRVQKKAKRGEIIEVKTTINHPMENGTRKDENGDIIQKKYITTFRCIFNGIEVFHSEWQVSISANPFLSFFMIVLESGKIDFEWIENTGQVFKESADISIEDST